MIHTLINMGQSRGNVRHREEKRGEGASWKGLMRRGVYVWKNSLL